MFSSSSISRKSKIVALVLVLLFLLLAVYVFYEYKSPKGFFAKRNADIQKTISNDDAHFTSLSGTEISIDSYVGKPLVVNIWASWSPFSKSDFEILDEVKKQFGDAVQIIAINRMETKETALAYIGYISAPESIDYIVDGNDHYYKSIEGYAMPETILYDSVGNEFFRKRGSLSKDEFLTAVKDLLQNNNP